MIFRLVANFGDQSLGEKIKHFLKFSLDENRIENCNLFSCPVFTTDFPEKNECHGTLRENS